LKGNFKKKNTSIKTNLTSLACFEFFSMDLDHFKLHPPTPKTLDFQSENPCFDLV